MNDAGYWLRNDVYRLKLAVTEVRRQRSVSVCRFVLPSVPTWQGRAGEGRILGNVCYHIQRETKKCLSTHSTCGQLSPQFPRAESLQMTIIDSHSSLIQSQSRLTEHQTFLPVGQSWGYCRHSDCVECREDSMQSSQFILLAALVNSFTVHVKEAESRTGNTQLGIKWELNFVLKLNPKLLQKVSMSN